MWIQPIQALSEGVSGFTLAWLPFRYGKCTMIEYRFKEELEYARHYANKLEDSDVDKVLTSGEVKNRNEALCLSTFFWKMVDASIEDEENKTKLRWIEDAEFWNEKLMYSFSGYLERSGYEREWGEVSDKQ